MPYPPSGGCTIRNFNLIRECAKNHEIHLLTFYQKAHKASSENLQNSIEEMKKYCKVVKAFEIPTDRSKLSWYTLLFFNLFSETPYSAWRFHSKAMVSAINSHAAKHSFDLVEIGTIALANLAKLVPDLPKLLVHHNIESELLLRRADNVGGPAGAYIRLQGRKLRRFEEQACRYFDHHTTVSERDRQTLLKMCSSTEATVVPNGVDTEYFMPTGDPIDDNSLVFVGGMTWYPNLDAMTYLVDEIWHLIKKRVPGVTMNAIGRNPSEKMIEFGKANPEFRVLGFVDDVRPTIAGSAVYIVPIRVGGGTRLKILDAMAMGKAIVSTTIGCEGIGVTHGKDIMIADNPNDLAERTVQLLNDRDLRAELGHNARQTAEKVYSWEIIAPKLERVYEQVAAKRKG